MANARLSTGDRAPAFTLPDHGLRRARLTEMRGRWMVLYFYVRDFSPGCTREACDFRDAVHHFGELGATVWGISPDAVDSHRRFRREHRLGFPLLHDRDAKVAHRYGAWREKSHQGRHYMGMVRSTFLIDPSGKIAHLWDNLRIKGHVERVHARLRKELRG